MKSLYIYENDRDLDLHLRRCGVDVSKEDKLTQNTKVRGWDFMSLEEVLRTAEWTQCPPRPYTTIYFSDYVLLTGTQVNLIYGYYCKVCTGSK